MSSTRQYLIPIFLMVGPCAFGATKNTCSFKGGSAEISYKGKQASVEIQYAQHGPTYHNCKVSSDEFGKRLQQIE